MNYQRTGFTPVPMHQDGATVSAFQFNRRIEHLQCWRRHSAVSASGVGTTLKVFFRRVGMLCSPSKSGLNMSSTFNFNSACAHASYSLTVAAPYTAAEQ